MTLDEARKCVKAEIKNQGMKVDYFAYSDITKAARELMKFENKPKAKQSRKAKGK